MEPIDIRTALATTPVQISSTGLVVDGHTPPPFLLGYLDSVLRGVGQVMMQNNSYAGLLFLIGVFYNSTLFGLAVLVGTSVSTATAMLLAVNRSLVRAGLFGFNGALVAIALLYFLQPDILTWGYVVLASACTTVLMAAMFNFFGTWKTPALTAPFIFTALCSFGVRALRPVAFDARLADRRASKGSDRRGHRDRIDGSGRSL